MNIESRLDNIERLLYALVPYRKLNAEQKARSQELLALPDRAIMTGDRAKVVQREWERLSKMEGGERGSTRFPKILIPKKVLCAKHGVIDEDPLPVVPMSLLINRAKQRKVFKTDPTEDVAAAIEALVSKLGLVITTIHKLGIPDGFDCGIVVVTDRKFAEERGVVKPRKKTVDEVLDELDMGEFKEEKPEPVALVETLEGRISKALDADEEETFEESDAAQGIAYAGRDLNEPDDELIDEDDDDPDDWGPDEVDFDNPARQELERAQEEAWQREQEALAKGDLVIVDGFPVANTNKKRK